MFNSFERLPIDREPEPVRVSGLPTKVIVGDIGEYDLTQLGEENKDSVFYKLTGTGFRCINDQVFPDDQPTGIQKSRFNHTQTPVLEANSPEDETQHIAFVVSDINNAIRIFDEIIRDSIDLRVDNIFEIHVIGENGLGSQVTGEPSREERMSLEATVARFSGLNNGLDPAVRIRRRYYLN